MHSLQLYDLNLMLTVILALTQTLTLTVTLILTLARIVQHSLQIHLWGQWPDWHRWALCLWPI